MIINLLENALWSTHSQATKLIYNRKYKKLIELWHRMDNLIGEETIRAALGSTLSRDEFATVRKFAPKRWPTRSKHA